MTPPNFTAIRRRIDRTMDLVLVATLLGCALAWIGGWG